MNYRKRAFTLIELLVVIAIIAILAAILFPVFAQAKLAAKKTQSTSNIKQTATAFMIYLADYDDQFPSAYSHGTQRCYGGGPYRLWVGYGGAYPTGWLNNQCGWYNDDEDYFHWSNSTEPYKKNLNLLEFAGVPDEGIGGSVTPAPNKTPGYSTMGMNGILHTYPHTSVSAIATTPLLWPIHGKARHKGMAYSSPYLACFSSTNPTCVFNPNTGPQGQTSGLQSGAMWYTDFGGDFSYWIYAKGFPIARTDSSVRFYRVGSPSRTVANNNPFNDPFATYDEVGIEWSFYPCYAPGRTTGVQYWCFFRPDRDGYGQ